MPDDGQIKVGLSIDTSGLDAAQSAAQQSATAIAAAYDRVTIAAKNNAAAQAQLGKAATEGSSQAAAVLAEYQGELTAATAALEELTAASAASAPALERQAIATRAAAAATNNLGVSARQGAAAGIGILEGRMMSGNRAAAAFLSTTLGLGPAIQMAFPIIGAIALAEVLYRIGEGAYNAYEKFVSLDSVWNKLTDDVMKMQDRDFINVHSIETATERLEKARDAAAGLRDVAEDLHKANIGDFIGALTRGDILGAGGSLAALTAAHGAAEASAQRQTQAIELNLKQLELQHQINDAKIDASHASDAALLPEQKISAEYSKRVALAKEEQKYNEMRDRLLGNATPQGGGSELLKAQEQAAGGEAYAQRMALQRKAVSDFVQESIAAYKQDEQESKRVTEAITNYWEELYRGEEEAEKHAEEGRRAATEDFKRDHEEQMRMLQEATEHNLKSTTQQEEEANKIIAFREKLLSISPREAEQQKIAVSYAAENERVGALSAQQAQYHPMEGADQAAEYKKLQDQMDDAARKGAAEREQITQQETLREVQAWQQAYQQMTTAVISATNEWMTTHKSFTNSFIDAGKHLAVEFIDDLLKMGAKWVEHEAMKFAVHEGWVAAQKTTDATAAASAVAVKASTNAAEIAMNAALATSEAGLAAATAAAEAAVGGPIAAIAAGSIMMAAMSPFVAAASAEGGGFLPGRRGQPVPIIGHGEELMIPAPLSTMLHSAAMNGGGAGGGHTFNTHSTINATVMDTRGLEGLARRSADANALHLKRAARRMNVTM